MSARSETLPVLIRSRLTGLDPDWARQQITIFKPKYVAATRRIADILLSLLLLILTIPLLLTAALLIKASSPGPVIYRQERLGLNNVRFTILKLRSMRMNAEPTGPQWAGIHDPRVTCIGHWLRATHIDELPQFFNVLVGTMSIIGPRPERPHFVEQLSAAVPRYNERALIKPGITGWAQVNYPYGASIHDASRKLLFDLHYVEHQSLFLDIRILLATVRVVLTRDGAR
jgi:exopolysaccharide biosynthesis polyprenyl glycosylphosphotransferase